MLFYDVLYYYQIILTIASSPLGLTKMLQMVAPINLVSAKVGLQETPKSHGVTCICMSIEYMSRNIMSFLKKKIK